MTMSTYTPPEGYIYDHLTALNFDLKRKLYSPSYNGDRNDDICKKAYKKVKDKYSKDIATQSDDHCVYCGTKIPSPDLDHWFPKGTRNEIQLKEDEILDHYRILSGLSVIKKGFEYNRKEFIREHDKKSPIQDELFFCIDPYNLMPSCPYCNQTRAVRMPDDSRDSRGKGSYFPVQSNGDKEPLPLFLHPTKKNWNRLLEFFWFIDIQDYDLLMKSDNLGSTALTLVTPSKKQLEARSFDALRTAATIEFLGLNRKTLAEDRFRLRQNFRLFIGQLENEILNSKCLTRYINNRESRSNDINPTFFAMAARIRGYILSSPQKLALLDELKTWLDDKFSKLDIERFMDVPNNGTLCK